MIQLISLVLSALAAYLPHAIFGVRLSMFADFAVSTLVGGIVYVISVYQLRKLKGEL